MAGVDLWRDLQEFAHRPVATTRSLTGTGVIPIAQGLVFYCEL